MQVHPFVSHRHLKNTIDQLNMDSVLPPIRKHPKSDCLDFQDTLVPPTGHHCRERSPPVCGQVINVPIYVNVTLPLISGNLPHTDMDIHLLVVSTCYNGHCEIKTRFRCVFYSEVDGTA